MNTSPDLAMLAEMPSAGGRFTSAMFPFFNPGAPKVSSFIFSNDNSREVKKASGVFQAGLILHLVFTCAVKSKYKDSGMERLLLSSIETLEMVMKR